MTRLNGGDALLRQVMQQREQRCGRGDLLVQMGVPHDSIYRLVTGSAARFRVLPDGRRQIICFFTPGDLIAARALLVERLTDSVVALSSTIVQSLDCGEAVQLATQSTDVAFRLMWQISEDERRMRNSIIMLGKGTAKQRISTMLLDILGRLAVAGGTGRWQVVALRQQDIADYLGLTLVHVNRTLRALREEGAIAVRVGAIAVRDRRVLLRYAAPMLDLYELEAPEFGAQP